MKIIALIISLFLLSATAYGAKKNSYKVESIEDGDTIVVDFKGKSQRIQLLGIDAPENTVNAKLNLDIRVKGLSKDSLLEIGSIATAHLKTQITAGQNIELQGDLSRPDRYGRIPAIVINEKGDSLNQLMVKNGYALLLTRFPLNSALKTSLDEAQKQAQKEKAGLWGSHAELMLKWSN